jgi:uncharacterized protein (DUF433 family)
MMLRDFERITIEPGKLGGKPCIRGMRISVQRVLEILSSNPSFVTGQSAWGRVGRERSSYMV